MKHVTKSELARMAGATWNTVDKHIRKAGLKPDEQGRYDAAAVIAAMKRHKTEDKNATHGPVASERARKLALEADLLQVKLDELRGLYRPVEEVRELWVRIASTVRERVLAIPSRLVEQVVDAVAGKRGLSGDKRQAAMVAVNKLLADECHAALASLAEGGGE